MLCVSSELSLIKRFVYATQLRSKRSLCWKDQLLKLFNLKMIIICNGSVLLCPYVCKISIFFIFLVGAKWHKLFATVLLMLVSISVNVLLVVNCIEWGSKWWEIKLYTFAFSWNILIILTALIYPSFTASNCTKITNYIRKS